MAEPEVKERIEQTTSLSQIVGVPLILFPLLFLMKCMK